MTCVQPGTCACQSLCRAVQASSCMAVSPGCLAVMPAMRGVHCTLQKAARMCCMYESQHLRMHLHAGVPRSATAAICDMSPRRQISEEFEVDTIAATATSLTTRNGEHSWMCR